MLIHGHNTRPKGIRNKSKTYSSWDAMIQRCTNENHSAYKDYGNRGIFVCERWKIFSNFLEDMGEKPEGFTLERGNNEYHYHKANCKWATRKEQQRNRRANVVIDLNGKKHCVSEWAEILGIKRETIAARLRYGWSIEKTLMIPVSRKNCGNPVLQVS